MPAILGAGVRANHQVDQRLRDQVIEEGEPLLEGQVIQSHIFGQKRRLPGQVPDGGQHRPDLRRARPPVDQEGARYSGMSPPSPACARPPGGRLSRPPTVPNDLPAGGLPRTSSAKLLDPPSVSPFLEARAQERRDALPGDLRAEHAGTQDQDVRIVVLACEP